jgi:hypothetical protein
MFSDDEDPPVRERELVEEAAQAVAVSEEERKLVEKEEEAVWKGLMADHQVVDLVRGAGKGKGSMKAVGAGPGVDKT